MDSLTLQEEVYLEVYLYEYETFEDVVTRLPYFIKTPLSSRQLAGG